MLKFEGLNVSYHKLGAGQPLLLLHGSGPGASSIGNWRAVLEPLASKFTVYAMDLIGFGQSARKPDEPYFDFAMWSRQAAAMLEIIPGPRVGLIGHSLSGALALTLAANDPRVAGVLTTGSMGAPFEPTEATCERFSILVSTHSTWWTPSSDSSTTPTRGPSPDAYGGSTCAAW